MKASLPPSSRTMKPNPFLGIEPLHRTGFLDGRFGREWCPASRRRIGPTRRGAGADAVLLFDTEDLGDLRSLLSRAPRGFRAFSSSFLFPPAPAVMPFAFEHAGMEEGVPRAVRQLDKPESLSRV